MPANLTPQYLEAERRFREAKSTEEKLAALDEMMAVIPKHKGTEHLRGDLKRRYAKLKADAEQARRRRGGFSVSVDREGAGQVVMVGPTQRREVFLGRSPQQVSDRGRRVSLHDPEADRRDDAVRQHPDPTRRPARRLGHLHGTVGALAGPSGRSLSTRG